jgi:thiamine-phosphate pyrophosphorylase
MTPTHDERIRRFTGAGIYFVTSASLSSGRDTLSVLRAALDGGIRLVQLREKDLSARRFADLARSARELTHRYDALFIVNDRLDVALACDADGVHLGQDDLPVADARRVAPSLIIGASSHSETEARAAQAAGASYVNIGPIFPTRTKEWTSAFLGLDGLDRIRRVLSVPFTVMGGIKAQHIPELVHHGAQTIAVVTAISQAPDPRMAAAQLLQAYAQATAG